MVFEQSELEDVVLDHFGTFFEGKRVPIYPPGEAADQISVTLEELEKILANPSPNFKPDEFEAKVCSPYTYTELVHTLNSLPNGKAAGYDNIANEMLRHTNLNSRLYLQTFLNQIISDGEVPPDLNLGKCMLIYKVPTPIQVKIRALKSLLLIKLTLRQSSIPNKSIPIVNLCYI